MDLVATPGETQHQAARIAGVAFLSGIAIVVLANYGISFRLIVPGNAADTARNILAHETLFRLNIAFDLLYLLNVVVLLSALHVLLKPVSHPVALIATFCRFVVALMWGLTALHMLGALRLLGDATYLAAFRADSLHGLARLQLAAGYDGYYLGLPFWGLASTACSWLLLRSRYIPRALAAFGVLASAWAVFCALAFLVFPSFRAVVGASWFDVPLVLFETALGLWLLIRGASLPGPARAA